MNFRAVGTVSVKNGKQPTYTGIMQKKRPGSGTAEKMRAERGK